MKKFFFLIASFVGIVTFSYAQGPVGHWRLGGNGPTPPFDAVNATNNTLGTLNNIPINFATNSIQRMRLTQGGFLGIGTTTPLSMLHINGSQGINVLTGEVFRTSCSGADSYWRMFAGAQRGAIFGLTGDNDFRVQSMTRDARLVFHSSFSTLAGQLVTDPEDTERMSISHTQRQTGAPGDPPFRAENITRVAISERGYSPITTPRSLLHLGFDLGANSGWRNWMDVGTFTNAQSDNMYVGLKDETSSDNWTDYQSAVISWADNVLPDSSTNRLRFIFTSNQGLAADYHGLEIARMVSDGNNGRMGVGNFFTNPGNPTIDPLNTMEIRSNPLFGDTRSGLRFTNLTALVPVDAPANSSNTVLSVDDDGDVILVEDRGGIGTCAAPTVLAADAGIQLNGNNFYFTGQDANFDKVGVGIPCGNAMSGKFQVENIVTNNTTTTPYAGAFMNSGNVTTAAGTFTVAVLGSSDILGRINLGGAFIGKGNGLICAGVRGLGDGTNGSRSQGGAFSGMNSSSSNTGILAEGIGGAFAIGGNFYGSNASVNRGIAASVATSTGGVGPFDLAGVFNGNISVNGGIITSSDKNLKENITPLVDALGMLSNVKPSHFNFINTPYMALPSGLQYGVIAQELESVFPDLVSDVIFPEVIDTAGNVLHPSQTWKGVNYTGLIPITIQAVKELDIIVSNATLSDAQLKQNVQPLQNSLSLVNQLNGVSFDWNQLVDTTLQLPAGTEIGLIAQAVEAVLPEVIYTDNKGYKHVEYQKIVPVLIEANKELQDSLTNLQNQLAALTQQVAAIQTCMDNLPIGAGCSGASARIANTTNNATSATETQRITLESDTDIAVLYQNQPNPFSSTTTIRYYLPNNVNEAIMVFHDEFGREIGNEVLSAKGYGQIEIDSDRLAAGIYTYSIVLDGKVFETKKMIKVK